MVLRRLPMKLARILAAATSSCVLLTVSAAAETCDRRYPGSCRLETSTTIVTTKGEAAPTPSHLIQRLVGRITGDTTATAPQITADAPQLSRRVKRVRKPLAAARKPRATAVRLTAIAPVPMPAPSPRRVAVPLTTKPTTLIAAPSATEPTTVIAAPSATKATTVVDQAFNTLTLSDSNDGALEAALISRRNLILESAVR
jgi:hypothetical protein